MFVIRPRAVEELTRLGQGMAQIYSDAGLEGVRTETGPLDMMTPRGFLAEEMAGGAGQLHLPRRPGRRSRAGHRPEPRPPQRPRGRRCTTDCR